MGTPVNLARQRDAGLGRQAPGDLERSGGKDAIGAASGERDLETISGFGNGHLSANPATIGRYF